MLNAALQEINKKRKVASSVGPISIQDEVILCSRGYTGLCTSIQDYCLCGDASQKAMSEGLEPFIVERLSLEMGTYPFIAIYDGKSAPQKLTNRRGRDEFWEIEIPQGGALLPKDTLVYWK